MGREGEGGGVLGREKEYSGWEREGGVLWVEVEGGGVLLVGEGG